MISWVCLYLVVGAIVGAVVWALEVEDLEDLPVITALMWPIVIIVSIAALLGMALLGLNDLFLWALEKIGRRSELWWLRRQRRKEEIERNRYRKGPGSEVLRDRP